MDGLLASVVLIAMLLGCLFVVGGLGYLLARRARSRSTRPPLATPLLGSKPWFGPGSGGYRYAPASPEGHAVALAAIAAAAYLAQAGQVLAAVAVAGVMMIIVFVTGTPPGHTRPRKISARR